MHGGVSTEGGMSEDGGARSNEEGGTIELSTYHKQQQIGEGGGGGAQGAADNSNISSNMKFAIVLQFNHKLKVRL